VHPSLSSLSPLLSSIEVSQEAEAGDTKPQFDCGKTVSRELL
jgi:hypothetical protein